MQRPNISKQQLPVLSVRTTESVNDKCHTWRGRLDKRGGLILSFPRIVAVYWDPFFGTARNAARMDQFFRDVGFHLSRAPGGKLEDGGRAGRTASPVEKFPI